MWPHPDDLVDPIEGSDALTTIAELAIDLPNVRLDAGELRKVSVRIERPNSCRQPERRAASDAEQIVNLLLDQSQSKNRPHAERSTAPYAVWIICGQTTLAAIGMS